MLGRAVLILLFAVPLYGQRPQAPQTPQTARQAVIEIVQSSGGGLIKHLPDAMLKALGTPGMAYGVVPNSLADKNTQVFEAGPVLLINEEPSGQKFQVNIDRDSLLGEEDEMDLSFHMFKDGMEQPLSTFLPRLSIKMGREHSVWKLKEVAANVRFQLDDPDFVKAVQETFQSTLESAGAGPGVGSMHALLMAEARYSALHPDRGYTCSLSELANLRGGTGQSSFPMIDPRLANGSTEDYKFSITGCGSAPVTTFQITAVPLSGGKPAYCADQTMQVKKSADGSPQSCVDNGKAVGPKTFITVAPHQPHSPRH